MFKHGTLKHLTGRRKLTLISSVLLGILLSALILVQSNVVQTKVVAEESYVVDLRTALTDTKYSKVALMDKLTGIPQLDGKDVLFIDGEYFLNAGQVEVDEVVRLLKKGMPIAFFGGGYERFRKIVPDLPHTESQIDGLPVSAIVEGLAIAPGKYVHGKPSVDMFRILGSEITASIVSQAYDMAIAAAEEIYSISQSPVTQSLSQETSFETLTSGDFGFPGSGWETPALLHMNTSSGNLFYPYGQLNSNRYYFVSDQEVAPGEFAILQQQRSTATPGGNVYLWNNEWRTADLWEELDARPFHIQSLSPTPDQSVSGQYTIGVAYYVSASWTGNLYNSYIDEMSYPWGGFASWDVNLPQSYNSSVFDSGIIWTVPTTESFGLQGIALQGNWAKWALQWWGGWGYDYHQTPEWYELDGYTW